MPCSRLPQKAQYRALQVLGRLDNDIVAEAGDLGGKSGDVAIVDVDERPLVCLLYTSRCV